MCLFVECPQYNNTQCIIHYNTNLAYVYIYMLIPTGSMVLVYVLTWMGYIDGKCCHIQQHHGSHGILLVNHPRLYPSNPRRWFHRPPQRSTVPLEAALPQEPTKTVLFPGLADWNICTCSSTSMSKIYMYYLHCIYLICIFQIGMCTHNINK